MKMPTKKNSHEYVLQDGGVKNRAKLFEQSSTDSPAPSPLRKPVVTNKPNVLAKPHAKESEEINPFKKFGAINSAQNGGAPVPAPKFKGGVNNALTPKGLRNDNASDSNNNKSATSEGKDATEGGPPKKALLPPTSPKNTLNAGGGVKPPATSSKPIIGEKPKPQIPAKVPTKGDVNKTDSICSTSSNSSSISNSSTSPSANNVSEEKGQFDFSKKLRPVVLNGLPPKKTIHSTDGGNTSHSSTSESNPSPISPPSLPKPAFPLPSPSSQISHHKNEHVSSTITAPDINLIEQRCKLKSRSKSVQEEEEETPAILRESDGKKFRKMTLDKTAHSALAPEKPTLPKDIDLSTLRKEYEKAVMQVKGSCSVTPSANQEEEEFEMEDDGLIYDDGESVPEMRPREVNSEASRKSDRVSVIPDMSAEEEGAYDDTPDDLYSAAETETPVKNEDPSETEQEKKRRKKEEKEREKQEREQEKQRKKKEEEKEKQRKKQEDEEMKRRKIFKITGNEKLIEGEIKSDAKGGNLNLKVRKGQKVTIVRMDNNPSNKWLVKTETQMGYVDSNIITVDPDKIKQKKLRPMTLKEALMNPFTAGKNLIEAMTKDRKESALEEDFDQPVYDAVPEDASGDGCIPAEDEQQYEDVYEEF